MNRATVIKGFAQLGELMRALGKKEEWKGFELGITADEYAKLNELILRQKAYNGWFTEDSVRQSLLALGNLLTEGGLKSWSDQYPPTKRTKRVAVIMAGNIPLVGFHDFLSVLLSGHIIVAKLSSDDKTLLPALVEHLIAFVPELKDRIVLTTGRIGEMDAVIATGSNNSLKYFEQYFGAYPHIFRKNRTSVAVLDGSETEEELTQLGLDVFNYFGLGCRNVTHLILPEGFELARFFKGAFAYSEIINHHKYANNYDYNKAIFLLNQHELLDNGFVLLRESEQLFSPLSMLNYHYYSDKKEVSAYLHEHEADIQVIVGHGYLPFGSAQCPGLTDYADNIDTMSWLASI